MRKLFESTGRVEARGQFVGERLIVNKAVGAGRADGLFVEAHRVTITAVDTSKLGPDQRGAILEIGRTIRRPELELLLTRSDSVQVLLSLAGRRGIAGSGLRQRGVEVIFSRFGR